MSTANYTFNLPTVGGSEDAWGTQLNANWVALDTRLFSGTIGANTTGNAATATLATTATTATSAVALQTARNINGVSFNGTADITLPTVNTSGTQSIGGAKTFTESVSVNGNVTATNFFGNGSNLTGITPTTAQVLSATAAASTGAVGSYAWLATVGEGSGPAGELIAASRLAYAGAATNGISGNGNILERSGGVSGTWLRMGFQLGYDNGIKGTLYLRVS